MIGAVAVMGFPLSDLKTWSVWEYHSVIAGWNEAHAPPEPELMPSDMLDNYAAALRAAKADPSRFN